MVCDHSVWKLHLMIWKLKKKKKPKTSLKTIEFNLQLILLFLQMAFSTSAGLINVMTKAMATHYVALQFSSVTQSCPTLCDPMDCSTPGLPVHHQLPEFTQTHVHWVSDAIQPSRSLLSPSPPAFNLSQHQGLFNWVSSSHQVAKVLEFQLQHLVSKNSLYLWNQIKIWKNFALVS